MAARDNNDRKYTLTVVKVDVGVMTGERGPGPGIVLDFQGDLNRKAKADIKNALTLGNFEIKTTRTMLA